MVVKRVVFGTVLCTCILGCMFAWKKMNGCYLCGDREDSLMSICGGRESIGIVHLNTMSILDTRIRIFDDEG